MDSIFLDQIVHVRCWLKFGVIGAQNVIVQNWAFSKESRIRGGKCVDFQTVISSHSMWTPTH
jgi:hypothetical protein